MEQYISIQEYDKIIFDLYQQQKNIKYLTILFVEI